MIEICTLHMLERPNCRVHFSARLPWPSKTRVSKSDTLINSLKMCYIEPLSTITLPSQSEVSKLVKMTRCIRRTTLIHQQQKSLLTRPAVTLRCTSGLDRLADVVFVPVVTALSAKLYVCSAAHGNTGCTIDLYIVPTLGHCLHIRCDCDQL